MTEGAMHRPRVPRAADLAARSLVTGASRRPRVPRCLLASGNPNTQLPVPFSPDNKLCLTHSPLENELYIYLLYPNVNIL